MGFPEWNHWPWPPFRHLCSLSSWFMTHCLLWPSTFLSVLLPACLLIFWFITFHDLVHFLPEMNITIKSQNQIFNFENFLLIWFLSFSYLVSIFFMVDHKPCGFVREVHWNIFYKGQAGEEKRSCTWVRIDFPNCGMLCGSVSQLCLLLATPWTAARQASLSFTISQSVLKFMSIEMPSNHLIVCSSCFGNTNLASCSQVFNKQREESLFR